MATTPTRQAGPRPQSTISPVIAAALLTVTIAAGVWYIGRDSGRPDAATTAGVPAGLAWIIHGRPDRAASACQRGAAG
jgi:hypothetical protein